MPAPVLGIDLGTTNSVVAHADEHRVRVLRGRDGQLVTPSIVSLDVGGRLLVGHEARERRLIDARNTVFSVKRLIGRPFRSPEVARAAERLPFALEEGPTGGVVVRARGTSYSLPEIASFILRKVRAVAEAALGQTCTSAVITVPANFNELQRMATRDAGHIAGLDVLRILNEPTAAALAYGYHAKQGQRIAVYDLGGGTFDISILELSGDVIEVVATAGDTHLGGDDLDRLVADRMVQDFKARYSLDLAEDAQQYERVRMAAEWIKCQLSHQDSAEAIVKEVAWGHRRKPLDLQFKLSRPALHELAAPLIERTFTSCEQALRLANVRPVQLDAVILVGGQTRTPAVRQLVGEFFEREPLASVDPELVVAQGAALQGYALSGVLAADLPRKAVRTWAGAPPPPEPAAVEAAPSGRPRPGEPPARKRSELPFEDLPTSADARDPDEELTKVAEYVSAGEVDAMFAAAEASGAARLSTLAGVGPVAQAANATGVSPPMAAAASAATAPAAAGGSARPTLSGAGGQPSSAGFSARVGGAPRVTVPPSRKPPPPPPPRRKTQPLPAPAAAAPTPAPEAEELPPVLRDAPPDWLGPKLTSPPANSQSARPEFSSPAETSARPVPPAAERRDSERWRPSDKPLTSLVLQADSSFSDPSPYSGDSQLLRSQFPGPPSHAPLLLDVTPHTLGVETTGGYCEPIIERNAPIPTEQTRLFSTSQDDQTVVHVRVCQGESRHTDDNQVLGQFALVGLRKARRGEVSIAVTFIIDADGTLNVRALDRSTGQGQAIRVDLVGALEEHDLEQLRLRQSHG